MKKSISSLRQLDPNRFETPAILKGLVGASRELAELKGVVASIPNQQILLNTLGIQEAKDSSEIENIVTTHDELFREASLLDAKDNAAAKEVLRYRQAMRVGFDLVRNQKLLTNNIIIRIQQELEQNDAGFRKVPGTTLRDAAGRVVYTPPQDGAEITRLMSELEEFINGKDSCQVDALVRMALIHHQFESIHPFYDGNGRTGRIINVLYLVKEGQLAIPVLYLSRYIVRTKSEYYRLLQAVREADAWEEWVLYMLRAIEETARAGVRTVKAIHAALLEIKHQVRRDHKFYSQDLINNIFFHPYTKVQFIEQELGVSRITATKYLDRLAEGGVLDKVKVGRSNFYINVRLFRILTESNPLPQRPKA
ncbi:MAG: Fic family protein [Gemmatimonadales bacterium]|nr:Fic family protein [Gemmatimonadales bacterium]MDZ4388652.1 Fic family protein [Gemmatimonadales bacterium]